jgi:hypothetical protein
MTRQSARGHICIRRKAKDGDPGKTGNPGLTIRTTAWETGKEYRNDTALDVSSVRYLDIVLDKPITVGVSNIKAYLCLKTHTSSASIPLGHTTYWQKMNSLAPIVTALILTQLLKAEHIDVNDLAANEAFIKKLVATALFTTQLTASEAFIEKLVASEFFIDNLYVKHLEAADGTFKGVVTVLNSLNQVIAKLGEAAYPLFLGGATAAAAVTKIKADGELETSKIKATGGDIVDLTSRRIRNPFGTITDSFTPIDDDNVVSDVIGSSSFRYSYSLDWSVKSSGRRQTIVGAVSISAPSGKYFFENGRKYTEFNSSYECSEMIGYGNDSTFYGWIVVRRTLFQTNRNFGRDMTPLAFGQVTGTSSGASFAKKKYVKFNDSDNIFVERGGTGIYNIYVPGTWFVSADYVYCSLTGVGTKKGSTPFIKATLLSVTFISSYKPSGASSYGSWYKISCGVSDDEKADDEGDFQFMIYNMAQWDD